MQEQHHPVLWVLLGGSVLGLLALALLRWVPSGHVLVVTRRGRVARVVPAGLRVRVPGSSSALVSTGPDVALVARGTTREGIQVRMYVEARGELVPPTRTVRYVDPVASAVLAAEAVLSRAVDQAELEALSAELERTWEALTAEVDRETAPRGMRVRSLRLVELDAVLATDLDLDGPR